MFNNFTWFLLFISYLALSGDFSWQNLILAALIATLITYLFRAIPFQFSTSPRQLPRFIWGFFRYIMLVGWELLAGALSTMQIILSREMQLKPGIIAIPSNLSNELATAFSAHAITVSPGEMVVMIEDVGTDDHIEGGIMYTHCLNFEVAEQAAASSQEKRARWLRMMFD